MRRLYSFLMTVASPLFVLRLWLKGRKAAEYRQRIAERFGHFHSPSDGIDVWFHAVSLGEVNATIPLIDALWASNPALRIALTTTTPTGSKRCQDYFQQRLFHVYLPFDMPYAVNRFLHQLKPRLGVIIETELWPNLIYLASKKGIPMALANARLSERSFSRYRLLGATYTSLLSQLRVVMAQTSEDGRRFIDLGLSCERLKVLGNMKFDVKPLDVDISLAKKLKKRWGEHRPVIIAGSTHEGEEAMVLEAFAACLKSHADCLLLIAPRHPERFARVESLVHACGHHLGMRSKEHGIDARCEVIIIDSIGELMPFYAVADLAFVGGSLVDVGGHNVLEPIALGIPVLVGPHVKNCRRIVHELREEGGLVMVRNKDELGQQVTKLLRQESLRTELVLNASTCLQNNVGVVKRYVACINDLMNKG